jgi:hypothetical protein
MTDGEFSFRKVAADGAAEGPEITLDTRRVWAKARCPCGGEYTAGTATNGDALLIHTLPACVAFELEDGVEFLTNARKNGARILAGGP